MQFKCLLCTGATLTKRGRPKSVTTIAKGSMKKHRTGKGCTGAKKMTNDLAALARAAPPPLSADDALKHARSVRPGL